MRLLVTCHGGAGHFHPLAAIASSAVDRGHEVLVATEPPYHERVSEAGFAAEAVGMWFDMAEPQRTFPEIVEHRGLDGAIWTMEHLFYGDLARAALPDLTELVDRWQPDVVLTETAEVAGLLVAELRGIPHATFNFGGLDLGVLRAIAGPAWERIRAEVGLPPDPELTTLSRHLIVAAMPTCWSGGSDDGVRRVRLTPHHGVDGRRDPRGGARRTETFVYATLGTVNRDKAALADVVAALTTLGVSALVTTGPGIDPASLGPPQPDVRIVSYAPHSEVLPDASAVVHHGGFNTLLDCLRAGLPQVLVPLDADQPLNAARAAELGVGVVVDDEVGRADAIAHAIHRVCSDPSFRLAAEQMADELDALDPVEAAVEDLEALAHP